MMKRLFSLFVLLFSLAPFGLAQTYTDTLYFEFELTEGTSSATIEYSFSNTVLSGIEMEYNDGQAHPKFTPTKNGNITVTGNGHGWIYYTYGESGGYSVRCSSLSGSNGEDIWMHTLSGVYLTGLDVHACSALKILKCWRNRLTSVNARGCTNLEELYCYYNQLTELDVSGCTSLANLNCTNNQLTGLDVSKNTALTELYCSNNRLTALDVSGCTVLTILGCAYNQLPSLDVNSNTALTQLGCDYNQLMALDVSNDTALTILRCENNQLIALDVS
ncbi:MAG: leucine-rich repeat domain-containing protein [Bacteroidales bacterium]|nr:leucine-rich repeat domain-containing protein [Bacteroidales bacterium]